MEDDPFSDPFLELRLQQGQEPPINGNCSMCVTMHDFYMKLDLEERQRQVTLGELSSRNHALQSDLERLSTENAHLLRDLEQSKSLLARCSTEVADLESRLSSSLEFSEEHREQHAQVLAALQAHIDAVREGFREWGTTWSIRVQDATKADIAEAVQNIQVLTPSAVRDTLTMLHEEWERTAAQVDRLRQFVTRPCYRSARADKHNAILCFRAWRAEAAASRRAVLVRALCRWRVEALRARNATQSRALAIVGDGKRHALQKAIIRMRRRAFTAWRLGARALAAETHDAFLDTVRSRLIQLKETQGVAPIFAAWRAHVHRERSLQASIDAFQRQQRRKRAAACVRAWCAQAAQLSRRRRLVDLSTMRMDRSAVRRTFREWRETVRVERRRRRRLAALVARSRVDQIRIAFRMWRDNTTHEAHTERVHNELQSVERLVHQHVARARLASVFLDWKAVSLSKRRRRLAVQRACMLLRRRLARAAFRTWRDTALTQAVHTAREALHEERGRYEALIDGVDELFGSRSDHEILTRFFNKWVERQRQNEAVREFTERVSDRRRARMLRARWEEWRRGYLHVEAVHERGAWLVHMRQRTALRKAMSRWVGALRRTEQADLQQQMEDLARTVRDMEQQPHRKCEERIQGLLARAKEDALIKETVLQRVEAMEQDMANIMQALQAERVAYRKLQRNYDLLQVHKMGELNVKSLFESRLGLSASQAEAKQ